MEEEDDEEGGGVSLLQWKTLKKLVLYVVLIILNLRFNSII